MTLPAPQGGGYSYRKAITIDHAKVLNTDQSNFPVLIKGTYAYLAQTANGGNVQNINGYDVIFTSDSGCATKLNHEVESYNAETGAVNYWVKVPLVSHSGDTVIYLCYGSASVTTDQSNKAGVWDANYKSIYHLPNGTTLSAADSTANGNIGTKGSSATAAAAQIGGGMILSGVNFANEHIQVTSNAGLRAGTITVSAWVKTTDATANRYALTEDDSVTRNWRLRQTATQFQFSTFDTAGTESLAGSATNFSLNTWHYLVGVLDGASGTLKLYVDGSNTATSSAPAMNTGTVDMHIGQKGDGGIPWKGTLDEVRYSNVARSADWIATEYNNQNLPSTFYSISDVTNYAYRRAITIDHTKVPNTDQSNFPVLINGTYGYLALVANGGNVQNTNGYDVIFTSDSGCATKLNHEVESYSAATGAVNYWVKVPLVSHSSDTVIYLCYGSASVTTDQSNKAGVWDTNYKGVYHLPNGTTLSAADSTTNANNGTKGSSATAAAAQIGGGMILSGVNFASEHIQVTSNAGLRAGTITVSAWVKTTDATGNRYAVTEDYSVIRNWRLRQTATQFQFSTIDTAGTEIITGSATNFSLNAWHYLVGVLDGATGTANLYVDGSNTATSSSLGALNTDTVDMHIGQKGDGGNTWKGALDEVRYSNVARSADWIATEYNNQNLPSTFYSMSPANNGGNQPPVANAGGPYTAPSGDVINVSGGGSSDPDGTILSYQWAFGDGGTCTAVICNHAYSTPGIYTVTLTVTDNFGATASATTASTITNRAPAVSLTGPANNAAFTAGSSVTLNSTASDNDGVINKVEFFQGATKLGEDTTSPYSFSWTSVPAGSYVLTAQATDNVGGMTTSSAVNVTVHQPPTVSLTSPANNAAFTAGSNITINASASGSGTVNKVEFFQGATKLGEDTTSPYSFSWTSVAAGSYVLTARATDNVGGATTSSAVNITVHQPPTVSLTSPANNAAFTAGSNITISANASGSGTVNKVEFFQGATKLGEDTTSPYSFAWTSVPAGSYVLTARATDNVGGATTSSAVNITVNQASLARLDPLNQTGGTGENPLSRNFNWSVPLVGLPGRAGLDLGLSLSYNSLVWTQSGTNISFDDDRGFPSAGFRLGFPVIQSRYFNSQVGRYAFMLITPNGERIELRQIANSSIYQAEDSSYLTLFVNADNTITVRTTDGTQLSYQLKVSDYQCTKIKDRNGNFISINYVPGSGRIDTVVDTLSRTIKFNYDTGNYLSSITQIWNQGMANEQNHEWASFSYNPALPIQINFPGLTTIGLQNNSTLKVLSSVKLNNNSSRFDFAYTSWGQVWKVSNYAADGDLLNYLSYNLPGSDLMATSAQSDCPRFTERHDWAANWNGDVDGMPVASEEAKTLFSQPINASLPDGSLPIVTMAKVTSPDETTYSQIYFAGTIEGTAGSAPAWKRGLTLQTDTFGRTDPSSPVVKQRSSASIWQDDLNGAYPVNPRVKETNIFDASGVAENHKRTSVNYQHVSLTDGTSYNLPQEVLEYQADATTALRRSLTDYNLDTTYTDLRIIGLMSKKELYEVDPNTQTETLMSKVVFAYDEGSIQGTDAPVQHDNPSYVIGRANLTSVKRYDTSPGSSAFVTSSMFYDTSGSLVKNLDFANHQTLFNYADKFAANGAALDAARPATFAYPTMVTDADGYTVNIHYHYDFAAVTWKQTPQPNTTANLPGPEQTFTYDGIARLQKAANITNGAYARYVYPSSQPGSQNRVDTFVTIKDGANEQNGNESHSFQIIDGHDRVIGSASSHPGSDGGFSGLRVIYDVMGRVFMTSNPTETHANGAPSQWDAVGDDQTAGWRFTQQTYDWKARPLVTINTDGTTKVASYAGCGCAGGEVVTLTDEGTVVDRTVKRRQQKVYSDIIGRAIKAEIYNWPDANGHTVYSTTVKTYNARDQITNIRQYQGPADPSSPFQDTTLDYDGFGRLWKRHTPEQQVDPLNPNSTDHATYTYNADDTLYSLTDARGATTTKTYNGRGLVIGITYSAPAGITATPKVSYDYDAVGNRISMSERDSQNNLVGSSSFQYDQLSRLEAETRYFSDLASSPTAGNYTINYQYNLGGQMTSITDPFGTQVAYDHDTVGRVTSVTGSGVSSYALNMKYRAWGGQKSVTYGDNKSATTSYDARMRPSAYDLPSLHEQFQYYDDGRLRQMTDLDDRNQDIGFPDTARHFSRGRSYDQLGRLTSDKGATFSSLPLFQNYSYDAFGNLSSRWGTHYYQAQAADSAIFSNNRRGDWSYYADGQVKHSPLAFDINSHESVYRDWSYDASGRMVQVQETMTSPSTVSTYTTGYDGDGQPVRESRTTASFTSTGYMIRSSVLGGRVLTRLDSAGAKTVTIVNLDGMLTAVQSTINGSNSVIWTHIDPLGLSEAGDTKPVYDALGNYVPWQHVPSGAPPNSYPPFSPNFGGLGASFGSRQDKDCVLNGLPISCSDLSHQIDIGSVVEDIMIMDSHGLRHVQGDIGSLGLGMFVLSIPRWDNEGLDWADGDTISALDDPPSLEQTVAGQCSIRVDFKGLGFKVQNGAGEASFRKPSYGVGFTVSGSVTAGAIGAVEVPDGNLGIKREPVNPNGAWVIQQWVSGSSQFVFEKDPKNIIYLGSPTHADGPSSSFRKIEGNAFVYADFPGPFKKDDDEGNLKSYAGELDFAVKVVNGSQQCEVKFHIRMSLNQGRWSGHWGLRL
jgi:YD repeat-containing protein